MLAKRSFGELSTQKEGSQSSEKPEPSILMMPSRRKVLKIEKLPPPNEEMRYCCEYRLGKLPSFGNVTLENLEHHLFFNRCKKLEDVIKIDFLSDLLI